MSDKYDEKPFNPFQYEYLKGNYVNREEYEEDAEKWQGMMTQLSKDTASNAQTVSTMLTIVKIIVGPITASIIGAIATMIVK